jgi:hypothetical protein
MVNEKTTKEKIEDLKALHQPTFDKLELKNPLFIPRICYIPIGEKEQVVSFFEQDFAKGKDIYTHFVSKGYDSEDPKNRLWKWSYNPYYATEYKKSDPHPDTGNIRFIVPVDELELIDEKYIDDVVGIDVSKFDIENAIPNPNEDPLIEQMTIRDLAAILLRQPVSRKKWLNEIVNK